MASLHDLWMEQALKNESLASLKVYRYSTFELLKLMFSLGWESCLVVPFDS